MRGRAGAPGAWASSRRVTAMGGTELFGALRERQFRLLWLGQATSTLGDGLVPVALSFAVIGTLNRSATALGVVLAAHILPLVLFVPRLRWLLIPAVLTMHVAIRIALGLDYSAQWLTVLIVFVNWPVVVDWTRRTLAPTPAPREIAR